MSAVNDYSIVWGTMLPLLWHNLWLISSITFSPDLFRVVISDPQIFLNPHIFLPVQLLLPPHRVSIHFFNQHDVIVKGVNVPTSTRYRGIACFNCSVTNSYQLTLGTPRLDVYTRATQLGLPYSQERAIITSGYNLSYSRLRWIVIYKCLFLISEHQGNKQLLDRIQMLNLHWIDLMYMFMSGQRIRQSYSFQSLRDTKY